MLRGNPIPFPAPVEDIDSIWSGPEKNTVYELLKYSFVGGPIQLKGSTIFFRPDSG